MSDREVKLRVSQFVRDTCSVLANPQNGIQLHQSLERMVSLLPGHKYVEGLPFDEAKFSEAQAEFMRCHYTNFLESLCQHWSVDWFSQLPKGSTRKLVDVFFLEGCLHEALLVLGHLLSGKNSGFQLNYVVLLLEKFIEGHKLQELFWCQCNVVLPSGDDMGNNKRIDPTTQLAWGEIIVLLASLPDKITGKLESQTKELFYPNKYVPFVSWEIMSVLHQVHANLKLDHDCSLQFLSQLLAKLCLIGHGELLWSEMLPCLSKLVLDDFIWARICEKLIIGGPERSLESVVLPIVRLAPSHEILSRVLGNAVVTSQKLQHILTNKLILLRYFEQDRILQNIIGYLATSPIRSPLYVKLLNRLMDVWGDASALKHTSYEQHHYISRAILICLAFMSEKQQVQLKNDLVQRLMPGMQCHLDSPLPRIRRLGMVVAESITTTLDPQGHKLQFEYEKDEEVQKLLALLSPPAKQSDDTLQSKLGELNLKHDTPREKPDDATKVEMKSAREKSDPGSDLDSDDDLEPYDMSNDEKVTKVKSPVYLRECLEGLISSDDPERVEACLLVAEQLIRAHPKSVTEIAAEFAKVLLHLQENAALTCFLRCRQAALVALAVTAPLQVANYLTHEFYERNYSIKQRLDILQTLAEAAHELSEPGNVSNTQETLGPKRAKITPVDPTMDIQKKDWQEIVQQRIESKTRRFGHGRTQPEPCVAANRFAPVAGVFFFPLMKNFDKQEACLDLLGEDHLVLGRLVYTLGVIIHAAVNAPVVRHMAAALLEFIWILRYHPQSGVRRALLFAMSMTVLSIPGHMLLSDLQTEITEGKGWLEYVLEKDPDQECRKLAVQALVLLENSVKQELQGNDI